jgi:hypothetical protein
LRPWFVALDVAAAASLLAAVMLVPADAASRAYAMLAIVSSVLPGLTLTGDVKRLVAGRSIDPHSLRSKAAATAAANLLVTGAAAVLLSSGGGLWPLAGFVVVAALGSTAQACTSIWYYVAARPTALLPSKSASAVLRVGLSVLAIVRGELTWAVISIPLAAACEFALNQRLARRLPAELAQTTPYVHSSWVEPSPLGAAYAASRAVQAAIKLAMEQLIGAMIATFLLIEQLVGGVNTLFEKYFARAQRARRAIVVVKLAYAATALALLPALVAADYTPGHWPALAALGWLALAGLLPLAEMLRALQRRSEKAVAFASAAVALCCGLGLAGVWFWDGPVGAASMALYLAMPIITFCAYWLASFHARHDTER